MVGGTGTAVRLGGGTPDADWLVVPADVCVGEDTPGALAPSVGDPPVQAAAENESDARTTVSALRMTIAHANPGGRVSPTG
ncbi:hypothetical protein GCM10028802_13650 [Terrabacter terrigena]